MTICYFESQLSSVSEKIFLAENVSDTTINEFVESVE